MPKLSKISNSKQAGSHLTQKQKKELVDLAHMPDDQINLSEIPEMSARDWKNALRGQFYRPVKQAVSMRLDADVIVWLKKRGKGYQTRANGILRKHMLEELKRV